MPTTPFSDSGRRHCVVANVRGSSKIIIKLANAEKNEKHYYSHQKIIFTCYAPYIMHHIVCMTYYASLLREAYIGGKRATPKKASLSSLFRKPGLLLLLDTL